MKMTPELKKAMGNMGPGIITAEGFLGSDKRTLSTIIDDDAQLMRRLNIDPPVLAAKMRHFMDEGRKGLGEPVTVDGDWIVKTDEARGYLACPWEDGIFRKVNVTIELKATGETLFYTDLLVHMVEEHGFFEGHGSSFRLDLTAAKRVLKI